jgi:hypothetical protein
METKKQKAKAEQMEKLNFKEASKLTCSHNSTLLYCNMCNRKFPMSKITKMVSTAKKTHNDRQGTEN